MKTLLITAPLTQIGSPYPATTVLKAYLNKEGYCAEQVDLGIELICKVFSREFLSEVFDMAFQQERLSSLAKNMAMNKAQVLFAVEAVKGFLQGRDYSLAQRIVSGTLLPNIARVKRCKDEDLEWAFGISGTIDKAKYLSTLFIKDIADFVAEVASTGFSLVRYMEQIALSLPHFTPLLKELNRENDLVECAMIELLEEKLQQHTPKLVGISVPFPGTLLSALKIGKHIKEKHRGITVAIGGGYINTELRDVTDNTIFDYVDYILYDDGELPLSTLIEHLEGKLPQEQIVRAKYSLDNKVTSSTNWHSNISEEQKPAADFSGLPLDSYMSVIEVTNPMHKLWSDQRWCKLTVAHGCYWAKCSFCDTKLDYIGRYDAPTAKTVVDRMERIVKQTGCSGFHFTDEALPPKLLKEIAQEILDRKLVVSYWGNVRFEKSYTTQVAELLAASGCIAVSGGLEVASDRILKLINKGVTIEQAARCMAAFNEAGIMVHCYLMYGFPTQTIQECIDSMEIVRQMFEEGLMQSAFWHRFAMTEHSEVGCNPAKFSVERVSNTKNPFANNAVEYYTIGDEQWGMVGTALELATSNYMQGVGYDLPLKRWFKGGLTVRTGVPRSYISGLF